MAKMLLEKEFEKNKSKGYLRFLRKSFEHLY